MARLSLKGPVCRYFNQMDLAMFLYFVHRNRCVVPFGMRVKFRDPGAHSSFRFLGSVSRGLGVGRLREACYCLSPPVSL